MLIFFLIETCTQPLCVDDKWQCIYPLHDTDSSDRQCVTLSRRVKCRWMSCWHCTAMATPASRRHLHQIPLHPTRPAVAWSAAVAAVMLRTRLRQLRLLARTDSSGAVPVDCWALIRRCTRHASWDVITLLLLSTRQITSCLLYAVTLHDKSSSCWHMMSATWSKNSLPF